MRAALALLLVAGCATVKPPVRATTISAVPVRSGEAWVSLAELGQGRPMVIEFFATWCEPCREQVLAADQLARRANGDLMVVAVSAAEAPAVVQRFVQHLGLTLPVYLDPELKFQDSLGSDAIPQVYVVDRAGKIVYQGATLGVNGRAAIDELMDSDRARR